MSGVTLARSAANEVYRSGWVGRISRKYFSLEAEKLIAEARWRTGLADFGEPPLDPALSILARSLDEEADLHALGRFLMRVHLRDLLTTRLRLVDYWRQRSSQMSATTVERPIFITGMPRSGSTFLHELLAEDPGNRAPRVWEVMFPVPVRTRPGAPDPRIKKAAACLWWFRRLAPQADAVFSMRAQTPHECVAIQSYSFISEEFISTCRVPSFEAYLRGADLRPAYQWQRRFLQHLQLGAPGRRWVLKSPDHVYGLEALLATFPDAVVIQTHRNPMDVLKSSCQLTQVLRGLYSKPRPGERLMERESAALATSVERFISFRDAHPELADRFIDVTYDEIVSNPLASMRRIYHQFGIQLRDDAAERMRSWALGRTRYQGRRNGEAGEPKLALGSQRASFERYCSRFNIGWRQPRTQ